jgi:outer membrane protein
MKSFSLIVIVVTVIFSTLTLAQQTVTLTVDKAVALALDKNTSVIQARNTVDAQQAASLAAIGALLPSLNISGSLNQYQNWSPITSGTRVLQDGTVITSVQGGYSRSFSDGAGLSSTFTIFNGFANTGNISRTKANSDASIYTLDRTQQSTIIQTHSLFLNVDRTYELLKVNEDNLKGSKEQLARIVESNKVGSLALADVYRQQVQVGTDEFNLIQAQANYEKAKVNLIAFLGIDFNTEYKFDFTGIPTDIDTTTFATVNAQYSDFNSLAASAMTKRPDYLASVENLNSADASVTVARASYYPSINITGSYGYNSPQLERIMLNQFTDYRGLTFGLTASLPIFNGFSTQNQIEQAEVGRKNANEQVRQNERQVRVDIRTALLDLEAAEKQVTVSQATVISAQMDKQIAEEKYNLGAGTLLDLLTATANYTTALSNKVNAVTGYILAQKQLEYVVGTIAK